MALAGLGMLGSVSTGAQCSVSQAVGSEEAVEWSLQMEFCLEGGSCLIIHQLGGGMSMRSGA